MLLNVTKVMLNQSILPFKQNFHWKSSRTINYYVTLKEHENFEPCEHVEIVMPLRIHTYTCNQDDNIAKPPRRSLDPTVMSRTVKRKGDIFFFKTFQSKTDSIHEKENACQGD